MKGQSNNSPIENNSHNYNYNNISLGLRTKIIHLATTLDKWSKKLDK